MLLMGFRLSLGFGNKDVVFGWDRKGWGGGGVEHSLWAVMIPGFEPFFSLTLLLHDTR